MNAVVADDHEGKAVLKLFYETNQSRIMEISRVDEKGVIRDDIPDSNAVGLDISHQKHVVELMRDHKPVISEVFRTIEGVDSIALHVPVLQGAEFKGSVEILVDFKSLAKRYLDVIKVGETGYAWVISQAGTILYTPVPGIHWQIHIGSQQGQPFVRCPGERYAPGSRGYRGIHLSKNRHRGR